MTDDRFEPKRLPDGRIDAPKAFHGEGGAIGDGRTLLTPGDPDFDVWDEYLKNKES